MNDNPVIANNNNFLYLKSFISIDDNKYSFRMMVKLTKIAIKLSLQDIYELNRKNMELISISSKILYAVVNKKFNNLYITFFSYSLLDLSKYISKRSLSLKNNNAEFLARS